MKIKNTLDLITIQNESLRFRFLESGDLYDMMTDHIQINLQKGNIMDGSLSSIYLRRRDDFSYSKLIHPKTITSIQSHEKGMIYKGIVFDITFELILTVHKDGWTYDLHLSSHNEVAVDLFYGQDVGIQDINGILNNEAYIVQYIDYKVFENQHGYTLCARQNQGQPFFFKWECVKKQLVIQQMRCNFLHQDKKPMVIFMHLIMIVLKTKFINMNRVILSYKVMSFTYLKKSNRFNFTDTSSNIMKTPLQNLTILLLMMLKYPKSKIYPSLIIH